MIKPFQIQSYNGTDGFMGAAIDDDVMKSEDVVLKFTGFEVGALVGFKFGKRQGAKIVNNNKEVFISRGEIDSHSAKDNDSLELIIDGFVMKVVAYRPFEIRHWLDLQAMRKNLSADYILMNNIELPQPGEDNFPDNGFEPVGDDANKFSGSLSGNRYKITNFYMESSNDFVGLFGAIETSKSISNFTLSVRQISGQNSTGGIVGKLFRGIYF